VRATVAASAAAVAAFIAASALAETAPRWRPQDGGDVVLVLPDSAARSFNDARTMTDPVLVAEQAEAFAALARRSRDARWFGRAEALVEPWIARPEAPPACSSQRPISRSSAMSSPWRAACWIARSPPGPMTPARACSAPMSPSCSATSVPPAPIAARCWRPAMLSLPRSASRPRRRDPGASRARGNCWRRSTSE
jgi:hypothetical protein